MNELRSVVFILIIVQKANFMHVVSYEIEFMRQQGTRTATRKFGG